MTKVNVLDTSTGRLQSLSRGQLQSVLKKHRREAAQMLKSSKAPYVVYALQHTQADGGASYHIIPCAPYSALRYKACFGGRGAKIKPLAVHR